MLTGFPYQRVPCFADADEPHELARRAIRAWIDLEVTLAGDRRQDDEPVLALGRRRGSIWSDGDGSTMPRAHSLGQQHVAVADAIRDFGDGLFELARHAKEAITAPRASGADK